MNIFDVVGENFFKPLTSQFKILYLDCLTIIYDSYRSELSYGIDREILVSKLSDYFERSNISDIEFEDEVEILKDSRILATPPAKIETIGEYVDTVLVTYRNGYSTIAEEYDL